jgi:transcriptional regulator with XRE-family HTH domain
LGVSQEELAARASVHRTYMGGIERGERNLGFMNFLQVAAALEVAPSELMSRYEAHSATLSTIRRKPS